MAVLNLRNVPDDLMRDLKKAALDAGQPFHAFCIGLLVRALAGPPAMPPYLEVDPQTLRAMFPKLEPSQRTDADFMVSPIMDPPKPPREPMRPHGWGEANLGHPAVDVKIT